MSPLLALRNIKKSFSGVKVLQGIDLTVQRGEIHALLGENGAGKSTLMKIICGIYQPDEGDILLQGKVRKFHHYRQAIHAGIGIIFQEFSLIPYMSAVDNIFLHREITTRTGLLDSKTMKKKANAILAKLRINLDIDCPVEQLSVAQQQFVEIAKALSLDARVLILDEPTATLTPNEAENLFSVMRELKSLSVGMVFISHHLDEIFTICDCITVLRDGQRIATLPVSQTDIDTLVNMMVGRRIEQTFPEKILRADKLDCLLQASIQQHKQGIIDQFSLYKGEILGFAGLVGSGRTELIATLLGVQSCYQKKVKLSGQPVKLTSPAVALNYGIGLLPENRKTQGLVLDFSVTENIMLNRHARRGKWLINSKKNALVSAELIKRVGVKTADADMPVKLLSGGNQQKVVIARWLNNVCDILIFDEPTRGIDVAAKAEIYQLMRKLTENGISVIMISSELPEIIGICDRVLVFRAGHIVAELSEHEIDATTIMLHATGNVL